MVTRPKHTAVKPFTVGSLTFKEGDPVLGGRPLDLGLRFGYVKSNAKVAQIDVAVVANETPLPDSPAEPPQENPS